MTDFKDRKEYLKEWNKNPARKQYQKEYQKKYTSLYREKLKERGYDFVTKEMLKETTKKFYYAYHNMKARCTNPKNYSTKYYLAKGISFTERWNTFENFKEDMWNSFVEKGGKEKKGTQLSLDRIDGNKGYSKENCRWTTAKVQSNNRSNNKLITFNGMTKNLKQWSEYLGLKYKTLHCRYTKGWSVQKILTYNI